MQQLIVVVDTTEVERDLDTFDREASRAIERQFEAVGRKTWQFVNATDAFQRRTGKLHRSIQWQKRSENVLRIFTAADVRYASFVNDGTMPHDIEASPGKMLRFVVAGSVVFRKRVHHPGTRPTLFFERAVNKSFDQAEAELPQRLETPIQHFNR